MKSWGHVRQLPIRKARIEIIPMIDTIFFLLVFFMFSSLSLVKMHGLDINQPKGSAAPTRKPPQVVITVDKAGAVFVGATKIASARLQAEMQSLVTAKPETVFIVNVDRQRPMQDIVTVMDCANRVQIPGHPNDPVGVMIATQPINSSGQALLSSPP